MGYKRNNKEMKWMSLLGKSEWSEYWQSGVSTSGNWKQRVCLCTCNIHKLSSLTNHPVGHNREHIPGFLPVVDWAGRRCMKIFLISVRSCPFCCASSLNWPLPYSDRAGQDSEWQCPTMQLLCVRWAGPLQITSNFTHLLAVSICQVHSPENNEKKLSLLCHNR